MSTETIEFDFFRIHSQSAMKSHYGKPLDQRRTLRDIQSAMAKIDPNVLKTVFANGSLDGRVPENNMSRLSPKSEPIFWKNGLVAPPAQPKHDAMIDLNSLSGSKTEKQSETEKSVLENATETAPLTIFYNGTVIVFEVSKDKAEKILKHAENGIAGAQGSADQSLALSSSTVSERQLLENLNGDLPIARKLSLQRFLEKRKGRITEVAPYLVGGPSSKEQKRKNTMESFKR